MFKKRVLLVSLLVVGLLFLAGCGSGAKTTGPAQTNSVSSGKTTYPLTVKDDSGSEVTLTKKPQRIISLVPSATETLFALGLEGRVAAVTKYDTYPQGVQQKVEYVFEDGLKPNNEQILKLNPDLVVLGIQDDKTITAIRNLNIPVVKFNPQSLEATYKTIEVLGTITDTKDQVGKIVAAMKEKEASIAKKVAGIKESERVRVWTEVDSSLFTPGQGTFLDELITKAGGVNIAADVKGWAQYSAEKVIAKNPQVIFTTYGYYEKNAVEKILARKGWENIAAVKNKRVVDLDSDMVTRPGPRIADGLESIAQALYPDLFK